MERPIEIIRFLRDMTAAPATGTGPDLRQCYARLIALSGGGRAWLFLPEDGNSLAEFCEADPEDRIGSAPALQQAVPEALAVADPGQLTAAPGLRRFLLQKKAGPVVLAPMLLGDRLTGLLCHAPPPGPGDDRDPSRDPGFLRECAALLGDLQTRAGNRSPRGEPTARLIRTVEALPDLMFEVDSAARYTSFMTGPRRMLPQPDLNVTGLSLDEVLSPPAARIMHHALQTVMRHGKISGVTYQSARADGPHLLELRGARRPSDEPDQPPTAIFLARDITREHLMREELSRMDSVMRAMSNLVIIVDPDLRVTWVNPAFERHTGWTLDEIHGQVITDLVRCDESDPAISAGVAEAIAAARPFSGQMVNKDRHGRHFYVDFNILPLFSTEGVLQGFVSVETVVTELEEQKIALGKLATEAAAAQLRLENALNALPDSIMIFDAQDRLVICNPAHRRAFARMADALVPGVTLSELVRVGVERGYFDGPSDPKKWQRYEEETLAPFRQASYSDELQIKDGRWFRRVNKRTSDGGLISAMIDITVRHRQMAELDTANERLWRALEQRELAEQRLSNIMEATRVGTWSLDLGRAMMTGCQHWARIIGVQTNTDISIPHAEFMDLVHPDDRGMLETDTPQSAALSPDVFEHEFRMLHRDGRWVWVLSRGRIVGRDAEGHPRQFEGVDIDISEQKQLELDIRQSDILLKSALESNVAAFAIYDGDNILQYCNAEAEHILKLKPGLYMGRQDGELRWRMEHVDGHPLAAGEGPCERARRENALLRDLRVAVRWPDGRRQVLTCNATPFDAGNGRIHTAISFRDITQQLEVTAQLEDALAHAEAMSKSKSIFLANMSHEIRTPLNGVLGLAEVLSLQIKDPEQSRMIATIRRSGETLLSVLNSILDMSKIEAGKIDIEYVPLRLLDILQQLEAVYSIQAAEKGLDFEVITSSGAEIPRIGDPHRIQQVLSNLLSNAIKFSSEGGVSLTVSCRPGRPVTFSISDTGVGMTADQRDRVFKSFEQADSSVTRRFGGTGLGLSIVRELVELMGGEITLESEPDVGTTVHVSLPLKMAEPAE
ncbi:PAS domain-containing sensor histidine kinase [Xinfangfangia pollutisoli]|uniref:PAS domain-containing sensor histidine kinase n=1 Tax=Xinfangfangia pollutisoli TaxID=2865960 RepID=UPI001CD60E6B|nr:ATP-binding protein [Xinfangfangia pollutisoli]